MSPGWYAAGSAAMLAVLVVLFAGRFGRLWRKMRDHPEKMGDEWDPFE